MKEKIIETSLGQFLEQGIRNITMQKLVSILGISTKTMYKYFENKEDLLEECVKMHYIDSNNWMQVLVEGSPNAVVAIRQVYARTTDLDFGTNHLFYHDLNFHYPALQDKIIKEYCQPAIQILTEIIEQGINEGYFLSYLKAPVVLEGLSLMYASVVRYDVDRKSEKMRELVNSTVTIYLRGICTEQGIKILNAYKESRSVSPQAKKAKFPLESQLQVPQQVD